jgi:hypothetical protein
MMNTSRFKALVLLCSFSNLLVTSARAVPTPEQDSLQVSRSLQPIPDNQWKDIAGDRLSADYQIENNDTLYDISGRLFGDNKYWPKIWALNNARITNPHFIKPGKKITFLPGTGSSLPGVEVADASTAVSADTPTPNEERPPEATVSDAPRSRNWKSAEWRKIPAGQQWETINVQLPPEVDPDGFDRRSKIQKKFPGGFELSEVPATTPIQPQGTIIGSRGEAIGIGLNETLFIETTQNLQNDQIFSVVGEPYLFKDKERDDLVLGYSYPVLGKIQIVGRTGQYTMGKVISLQGAITRGTFLIHPPARVNTMDPAPGTNAVEANVMLSRHNAAYAAAQGKILYLTRGTEDGVQPGMVFRVFQTSDPYTGEPISRDGVLREADLQIILSSDKLSMAIVRNSSSTVLEGARAVLLTDISDVDQKVEFRQGAVVDDGVPAAKPAEGTPAEAPDATPTAPTTSSEDERAAPVEGTETPIEETPEVPVDGLGTNLEAPLPPPADSSGDGLATPDDLEKLDDGKPIQEGEKKALDQLESWEGNSVQPPAPTAPLENEFGGAEAPPLPAPTGGPDELE